MITIQIPAGEMYDNSKEEFIFVFETTLHLEHCLVSVSKWESRWHKPFLTKDEKSIEESVDYIRCMTTDPDVDPNVYNFITHTHMQIVNDYIEAPMTATVFGKSQNPPSREIITSELVYYWMIALSIPFECQHWHFNRLLTLVNVCNIKNQPAKKMSKGDLIRRNQSLNEQRRAALNTKG